MFGAKEGTNLEGFSIPSLPWGIYEGVELVEVKKENTTKKDGTSGKDILTFLFKTSDGRMHQHTEYGVAPDEAKAAEKAEQMSTRIGHILTKFIARETVNAIQGATFNEYAQNVINTLGEAHKGVKDLDLKIVGNVYQGEAKTQIPMFPPFIARKSRSDYKSLSFDAYANNENAKYDKHFAAKPDADGAASNTTSSTGAGDVKVDADF